MKRVVVKRKKAGSGVKRKAPRRRPATKQVAAKTESAATKRRKRVKPKASARQGSSKRKTATRKSPRKLKVRPLAPTMLPASQNPSSKNTALGSQGLGRSRPPITKRKTVAPQPPLRIPPILLEGDEPELHAASGPGEKFSLGPETPAAHFAAAATHLPPSYGTGRLFLTARDPHWIYAHWDIKPQVQFQHNARSVDRHLILRMHERDLDNQAIAEIHVHPESHHWFAHVERAGQLYVADLGYYQPGRKWKSLAISSVVRTPSDTVSPDANVAFATIPAEVPFETMLSLLQEGEAQQLPLAQAIQHLRERQVREFPAVRTESAWTPEQESALAEILASGQAQRALRGSQEIPGLPVELPALEHLPAAVGPFGSPSSFGDYNSSPMGGEETGPEFWLKLNAELILYGATKPNAQVTIGGKPVALRPDGSFSCRFALPDGQYELPVVAVASDDTDVRAAELKFSRATTVSGDVGALPLDPALKPPPPDSV